MSDFIDFIRKQGVVKLAVGFILGGAVKRIENFFDNNFGRIK